MMIIFAQKNLQVTDIGKERNMAERGGGIQIFAGWWSTNRGSLWSQCGTPPDIAATIWNASRVFIKLNSDKIFFMKSLNQIKTELHQYIDGISDEKELMVLYESTLKDQKSDSGKDKTPEHHPIPNSQQQILAETIDHGSSAKIKRDKELKKSIDRWFSDGGKNPG